VIQSDTDIGHWISGIAFGKNLWNHAKNSAYAFFKKINDGSNIGLESDKWNNDVLAYIPKDETTDLMVPIVPNGKDKILYFIEHNDSW